jgi:hypothetical protein
MLDTLGTVNAIGTVTGPVVIMANLTAMAGALPLSPRGKILLAAGVGAWTGLATVAAESGALAVSPGQPLPVVGIFFATPLIATASLWFASPSFRQALLGIPASVLVGLNSMRVLGALFLGLAAVGKLSGPFPYFAGIGDVITGIGAVGLAFALTGGLAGYERTVRFWNIFGALDLFVAVFLGLTSAEGSPLQIFHVGAGSEAMQHLPFALVPTVLVPFYLITHGVVAAQLSARKHVRDLGDERHVAGTPVASRA